MTNKARQIKPSTTKKLFALSRNECARPGCHNKMISDDGKSIHGQIAHIAAASDDGPRYDHKMTEEQRRSFDNLILLCPQCHKMIDDSPEDYPTNDLIEWKDKHEGNALSTNEKLSKHETIVNQHADKIYNIDHIDNATFN
ncbi:HNH endonuclease [Winogradskyella sp.]|uniref:HNH endonuclease n=1 Tax=Winogradskyella sp. TaxID=1883156 RepID=UPI003BA8B7BE